MKGEAIKPTSTDDIFNLIDSGITSAVLIAALELGLFWILEEQPLRVNELADRLSMPSARCLYWLRILESAGLIDQTDAGFIPSEVAKSAILEPYSQDTWAFLAGETRDRLPVVCNLTNFIKMAGSLWEAQGLTAPNYFTKLVEDPDRAERFTRMLFELHQALAGDLAAFLDLDGVGRLLDLGGGSGVMSLALLRKYPELSSTVLDIPNVCAVGNEIAVENSLDDRITFHAIDFMKEELPSSEFEVVLECDINVYSEELFEKVKRALVPGGRFIIVDQFALSDTIPHPTRVFWAFLASLENPDASLTTSHSVRSMLENVGFYIEAEIMLPVHQQYRWDQNWTVIEARYD